MHARPDAARMDEEIQSKDDSYLGLTAAQGPRGLFLEIFKRESRGASFRMEVYGAYVG